MVRITANILGFTRAGIVYNFVPTVFRRGDTIDLDCTPRDADNQRTANHPKNAEWYPNSTEGGLVINRDYTMARDNTFQPELYIRDLAPAGTLSVYCKAAGVNILSNTVQLPIRP